MTNQRILLCFLRENGGSFVGVRADGGDPLPTNPMFAPPRSAAAWGGYVDTLIGAQFVVHSKIVPGAVHIEDEQSPITKGRPEVWQRSDEWYGFQENPRNKPGFPILATMDEKSYAPGKASMGADHPLIWWHAWATDMRSTRLSAMPPHTMRNH